MWEVTLLDHGVEVGTFDIDEVPEFGVLIGDAEIVEVVEIDDESRTATVEVRYVV